MSCAIWAVYEYVVSLRTHKQSWVRVECCVVPMVRHAERLLLYKLTTQFRHSAQHVCVCVCMCVCVCVCVCALDLCSCLDGLWGSIGLPFLQPPIHRHPHCILVTASHGSLFPKICAAPRWEPPPRTDWNIPAFHGGQTSHSLPLCLCHLQGGCRGAALCSVDRRL